jgi:hypothetical protein
MLKQMTSISQRHIFAKEKMMEGYNPEKAEKFYHLLHKTQYREEGMEEQSDQIDTQDIE